MILASITDEDLQGFMETVYGLKTKELDIILHSPGGSAESVEAIVSYLRKKFDDIRIIIPQAAMSAATMFACASNEIVMGNQSSLGPIDPQMTVFTQFGIKMTPAQALIDEFEEAQNLAVEKPDRLGAWIPLLGQYTPGLIQQCRHAKSLAEELTGSWLKTYMFAKTVDGEAMSQKIADTLSSHAKLKSHSRHISRERGRELGLKITALESDQMFQDLVLSVFHATNITFQKTGIMKIIENHNGRTYLKASHTPQ